MLKLVHLFNNINDTQKLGFNYINVIKQFESTLKNPITWIIRKDKHTVILLFLKKVLVVVFIFLKSGYIELNFDFLSFTLFECLVSKSDNLIFLNDLPPISNFILKLKRDFDELTNETPQSDYSKLSTNKFLKKILKLIDPVISDQQFWRILSEFGKPIKSKLTVASQFKIQPRNSSFIFAEALDIPNTRKLSSMQKRVQLKMAKSDFSNN